MDQWRLEQERDRQFLRIIQQVTGLTAMARDHQEVMETIVRRLPDLLGIDACTIRLLDSSTRTFVLGAAHGVSLEYLSREVIDTEATMAMVQSGHPVHTSHVDEDPFVPFRDEASREGIKGVLTLPVLFQGELIGIMRLLTRSDRNFTAGEISCCMVLAEQVGIAIAHGRVFAEMEIRLGFLRDIQAMSKLVNSTLELNPIFQAMAERVAVSMQAKGCTLRLLDPATGRLQLAAAHGVSQAYLDRGGVEGEAAIRLVLAGEPVAIYDVQRDSRVAFHEQMQAEGIVSLLAVPLRVDGEIIGAMRVLTDRPRVFTDAEVRFAATLAEVGSTAIRNAGTYQKINVLLDRIEGKEQFLANIINSLEHQLLVLNRQRRVVLANRKFLEALGKTEPEVVGMHYGELCRSDEEGATCPVDQVFQGEVMRPFVQPFQAGDSSRWYERAASPIRDSEGRIDYVIEIIRDITAERLLAEERSESGRLQGIVELAGTVAHEINSPLFAALGTAEMLAEEDLGAEAGGELAIVIRNLRQIGELTRKMTTMTGFARTTYVGERSILTLANDAEDSIVEQTDKKEAHNRRGQGTPGLGVNAPCWPGHNRVDKLPSELCGVTATDHQHSKGENGHEHKS